jgi:hypothetical protein
MTRPYGVGGPPQLAGRTRPPSPDERFGWMRRRVAGLVSGPEDWVRRVVCTCRREDAFRVSVTDPFLDLFSRGGIGVGVVRLELTCGACGSALTVFDNQMNGWNAVMAGEREELPPDYAARVQASLQPVTCLCGSTGFGCLVWFCYDAHPDDLPASDEDWDEAFGAFAAWTICSRCGVAQQVAEAETA